MRTGPVALAYLGDPEGLVVAAMALSALTHHEEIAQQACAVWSLMIRHAVLNGAFPAFPAFEEIEAWVPDPNHWRALLAEAELGRPETFVNNMWAVGALQAAWSAICNTSVPTSGDPCAHLVEALTTAIRIGCDTDTVAAIAGALLGARWGMTAVPARWRRILHGWPLSEGRQLEQLAYLTARGGLPGKYNWPEVEYIDYTRLQFGKPALARHPFDEGVWLGGATALDEIPKDVDAVVSLCLTGTAQVPPTVEHLTFRLMDEPEPDQNPNLDYVLVDAANAVAALRDEGKKVLLHCVAAHSRTPTVGSFTRCCAVTPWPTRPVRSAVRCRRPARTAGSVRR